MAEGDPEDLAQPSEDNGRGEGMGRSGPYAGQVSVPRTRASATANTSAKATTSGVVGRRDAGRGRWTTWRGPPADPMARMATLIVTAPRPERHEHGAARRSGPPCRTGRRTTAHGGRGRGTRSADRWRR